MSSTGKNTRQTREDDESGSTSSRSPVRSAKVLDPNVAARVHRQIADGQPDVNDMSVWPTNRGSSDWQT